MAVAAMMMSMALLGATPAPAPARAAAASCTATLTFDLDRRSFAANGASAHFTAARLAGFLTRATALLRPIIDDGCRRDARLRQRITGYRRLTFVSASGATEGDFFHDPDGPATALTFEYSFAEDDLRLPPAGAIREALGCVAPPAGHECAPDD